MRFVSVLAICGAFAVACEEKAATSGTDAAGPAVASAAPTPVPLPSASAVASAALDASAARPAKIIAQHILIAYRGAKGAPKTVTRSKADAKKRADEVVAKIQAGEDFSTLVKTYSDDPGSVDRQGSVGKFAPGDMAPAFSAAAFALRVDETSAPVETAFGFHVIRRTQ